MEKERKTKIISLAALIIAVLGLTVAFAAMSQTLTINGTASLDAAEWDIHFENLTGPDITGTGRSNSTPVLDNTSITYSASVTKPGDSVTYYFDIVNNGTINAKLDTDLGASLFYKGYSMCVNSTSEECTSKYDFDGNGSINVNDYVIFTKFITYAIFDTDTNEMLAKDDVINAKTTKHCKLVLMIKEDCSYLSKKDLSVTDTFELNFVQSD